MATPSQPKVYFFSEGIRMPPINKTRLIEFVEHLFKLEGKNLETLVYVLTSDKKILEINQEYLNHDYYTDILSFSLSKPKAKMLGEIYISIPRVKENARALRIPFKTEILRVIIHGALHLCGYKDQTPQQIALIRKKEDKYIEKYFSPVPRENR